MFKRGQVVQHASSNRVGVIVKLHKNGNAATQWFDGGTAFNLTASDVAPVTNPERYAFEAALALGDTATTLRLYREAQAALEPFAAYGRLKLRYPANAVFTIAYDREGREVILLFEDFTRAAEVHPNAVGRTRATTAQGGAGGIAEIAVGATEMTHDQRIAIANRDIEGYLRAAGQWVESDREYRVRYVTADGETCYARVHTASAEKAAALVRDAIRTATAIEVLTPDEVSK